MKNALQVSAVSLLFAVLLTAQQTTAQKTSPGKDRIDKLTDVLPKSVVTELTKSSKGSLGSRLVDKPVHFIVNANLRDPEKLDRKLEGWATGQFKLSDKRRRALCAKHPSRGTRVRKNLLDVSRQFLDLVFETTIPAKNLESVVSQIEGAHGTFILFCFDLRSLRERRPKSQSVLELELSMRVFRVHLGSQTKGGRLRSIESVSCLFQDHAIGTAPLPADEDDEDALQRCVAVAAVDAFRYQIALNLLDNKRLAKNWLTMKPLAPTTTKGGAK